MLLKYGGVSALQGQINLPGANMNCVSSVSVQVIHYFYPRIQHKVCCVAIFEYPLNLFRDIRFR